VGQEEDFSSAFRARSLVRLLTQLLSCTTGTALLLLADLLALLRLQGLFALDFFLKAISQEASRQKAVQSLRAPLLNLDGDARRAVGEAHTRRCFIHMLPAWPGGSHKRLLEILLMDLERMQARFKGSLFFRTDAELAHSFMIAQKNATIQPPVLRRDLEAKSWRLER
jgi:hypothetical protein